MPHHTDPIEAEAQQILQRYHVDEPPVPVEAICRKHGLGLRYQPLESTLSGFLYPGAQQSVIGVNSAQPKVRQRFTIAHELGHFLLHKEQLRQEPSQVYVDRSFTFAIQRRDPLSSQGVKREEIEANRFAAALLMPAAFLARDMSRVHELDLIDDKSLSELAQRYGVSLQALYFRLTNLGYLSNAESIEA